MGQFGVGQALRRQEDPTFLRGEGRYTDDITLEGQCHGIFVRSPYAHAKILSIETEDALDLPGVLAVLTYEDLKALDIGDIPVLAAMPGKDGSKTLIPPYPALADGLVRHVGNPVALVLAESKEIARDAAELVMVDYEPLEALVETAAALEPGAPLVHEAITGNRSLLWAAGDEAKTNAAFEKADRVARLRLINNRVVVNSMEPRGAVVDIDETGRLTLYSGNQGIARLKGQLCDTILKSPHDQLRLVCPDVGGGFGMKIFCYPEVVCCLVAAKRLGRPVKWISERTEAFLSDTQARDHVSDVEMAMDSDGHFLGFRVNTLAAMGAFLSNFGPYIPTAASTQMFSGLYKIPAIYAEVSCVFTHTVPVDAYRGAGRPEAAYLMERMVDACAKEMGLDPLEIRRRNFIRPDDLPYDTGLGRVYDSGDYSAIMEIASKKADWAGFEARRAESQTRGLLRGIGLASYVEACSGIGAEEAQVRLDPDGGVTLIVGTQTNGQGHLTAYAQLLNDKLGVAPEQVRMVQGDSDIVRRGAGTGGSRSLLMGGVATNRAAEALIEKTRAVASHLLEAAEVDLEFEDGRFSIVGTDRSITLRDVAKSQQSEDLPEELRGPLEGEGDYEAEGMTFPNGCHICEVEVDPDTGIVTPVSYVIADDFGTVVNPLLVAGQVHGGVAQGLGQALLEYTHYDEDGQLLTASFMDYCMPRADNLPEIDLTLVQDYPCKTNPMGVKGAGEAGAIGAPPALINAVLDALFPLGVETIDMPATPEKVWRAIQTAKAQRKAA